MRPKDIGTAAETAVVTYLRPWWPHVERRALMGGNDCGDITGTPGVCWEVKGGKAAERAGDGQVALWLAETERERRNAKADVGVLVMKRAGIGAARAGQWWAVLPLNIVSDLYDITSGHRPVRVHLSTAVDLLRRAGYGDPR